MNINIYKSLFLAAIISCCALFATAQGLSNEEKIQQVYVEYASSLTTIQLDRLNNCLSRCSVIAISDIEAGITIENINDIPLNTKFTFSLVYDETYDFSTFNPLKYLIKFNKSYNQYFQIGSSDFVLKVGKEL